MLALQDMSQAEGIAVLREIIQRISEGYQPHDLKAISEALAEALPRFDSKTQQAATFALKQVQIARRGAGHWPSNANLRKAKELLSEAASQHELEPNRAENFIATAVGQAGKILGQFEGESVKSLIGKIDAEFPNARSASISGEYTSDGTYWGPGRGRVVASREPRTLEGGRFYAGWIVDDPMSGKALTPNRTLMRSELEALAWQLTPQDYRGSSGSKREVLLNTTEGTTLVPLSSMTDFQLRRYIGPGRLEEAGDMAKNGKGIYAGTAAQEDDYVIWTHGHSRRFFVDHVRRSGTRNLIGKAKGEATLPEAIDAVRKHARTQGITSGVIFEMPHGEDELRQIGHTDSRFEANRGDLVFVVGDHATRKDGNCDGEIVDITTKRGAPEYLVELTNGDRVWFDGSQLEVPRHQKNARRRKLRSESDTAEVRKEVEALGDAPHTISAHFEHGQWWATCSCGAQWSVVDTNRGLALEQVSDGDEDYHQGVENFDDRYRDNARREEPDEVAARELSLYIENEYALVGAPNSQGQAIEKNLLKKIKNGTFDLALSEKAWMYLMETGAKKYSKEFGDGEAGWARMFNKPTRELVAHEFATTFAQEHGAGEELAPNVGQPFQGRQTVVIEKRDSSGRLDFSAPQPPRNSATFDEVYEWYFRAVPEGDTASWADLKAWLDERGWVLRAKTW